MSSYLILYLLVVSYSFTPNVIGFGINDTFVFSSIEEAANEVYKIKEIEKFTGEIKLFKITLSAENEWHPTHFTTKHFKEIEEIEIPELVLKGSQ